MTKIQTNLHLILVLALAACGGSESDELAESESDVTVSGRLQVGVAVARDLAASVRPVGSSDDDGPIVSAIKIPGKRILTVAGVASYQCLCEGTTESSSCQWDIDPGAGSATCIGTCGAEKSCKVKTLLGGGAVGGPAQTEGAGGP